jgi:hypothetical protein
MTRRGLLSSGVVAAVGATTVGSALGDTQSPAAEPDERFDMATVAAVEDGAMLKMRKQDGTEERLQDPKAGEEWVVGDEAMIIWQYLQGAWTLVNVQRMYRPIEGLRVEAREGGGLIDTSAQPLQLTPESVPRAAPDFEAVPLNSIDPGSNVSGIGHLEPGSNTLAVDQIGVEKG